METIRKYIFVSVMSAPKKYLRYSQLVYMFRVCCTGYGRNMWDSRRWSMRAFFCLLQYGDLSVTAYGVWKESARGTIPEYVRRTLASQPQFQIFSPRYACIFCNTSCYDTKKKNIITKSICIRISEKHVFSIKSILST